MTDLIMPPNSVRLMRDGVCSHQPRLTTTASCFRTAGPSSVPSRISRPPERENTGAQ